MHFPAPRTAVLVALSALLPACGSAATNSSSAATSTTSAATAPPTPTPVALKSFGPFAISVPAAWSDRTSTRAGAGGVGRTTLMLLSAEPVGPIVTNSNDQRGDLEVAQLSSPIEPGGWRAYLDSASTSFGNGSASTPQALTIGGDAALAETYSVSTQGTPGTAEDIMVNHNGVSYNITFTDSLVGYPKHIDEVTAMIASIRWS